MRICRQNISAKFDNNTIQAEKSLLCAPAHKPESSELVHFESIREICGVDSLQFEVQSGLEQQKPFLCSRGVFQQIWMDFWITERIAKRITKRITKSITERIARSLQRSFLSFYNLSDHSLGGRLIEVIRTSNGNPRSRMLPKRLHKCSGENPFRIAGLDRRNMFLARTSFDPSSSGRRFCRIRCLSLHLGLSDRIWPVICRRRSRSAASREILRILAQNRQLYCVKISPPARWSEHWFDKFANKFQQNPLKRSEARLELLELFLQLVKTN